jgi:biopolymer transport protein ExbB
MQDIVMTVRAVRRVAQWSLALVVTVVLATAAMAQDSGSSSYSPPGAATNSPAAPATSVATPTPAVPQESAAPATDAAPASSSAVSIGAAMLPRDLSPWGMFLNADIIVKVVMVGLLFASLVTWTVWLAKNFELWRAMRRGRAALAILNETRSLAEANSRLGAGKAARETVARLLRTAVQEVQASPHPDPDALKERISWLLERVEAGASRSIGRGMGLLASIGATAPFVGLFGTVWGIMNSFIGISNAHTTNLAVVAPGIAEALLATALGLFAAIPAVVIYNVFSRSIGGYRAMLADGSALVMRLVSRDCERVYSPMATGHLSQAAAE